MVKDKILAVILLSITFSLTAFGKVEQYLPRKGLLEKYYTFHESKSEHFIEFSICKNMDCKTLLIKSLDEKIAANISAAFIYLKLPEALEWRSDHVVKKFFAFNFKSKKCKDEIKCVFEFLQEKYGIRLLETSLDGDRIIIKPNSDLNVD